ncbi:aquaporin-like protein [Glomus cerebriforme]|uniref:Aquaporin-like protein n=1 Tax=Glomus cerebriforme TaxID=658196 RepID=A0A397TUV1_9GLOM|nr:aquaporin-like protein [Glomus cerebriforme]
MADEQGAINKSGPSSNYGATENNGGGSGGTRETGEATEDVIVIQDSGWQFVKFKFREPFAEFLGTFILVAFGVGSIAQTVLSKGLNGNWITIALGFGLGLALGIVVSGNYSGGHLNPAVTITLAVYRKFPWIKVPVYITAQTLGAFAAAAVVYVNYVAAIDNYAGDKRDVTGVNATAGIFATYPQPFMSNTGAFFSELLGTFLLLLIILALTDERNVPSARIVTPLTIGLTLSAIAISFGYETGFSLNGARDFGPRLFTFFVGYGVDVFSASSYYFWIPIVAPVVGGLFAGLVYDSMIYWGEKSPLNKNIHHEQRAIA